MSFHIFELRTFFKPASNLQYIIVLRIEIEAFHLPGGMLHEKDCKNCQKMRKKYYENRLTIEIIFLWVEEEDVE